MKIRVYQIIIIIITIIVLSFCFLFFSKTISNQILSSKDIVKPVSIGCDQKYIYLIYSDLTSKKIYKFSHYYNSEYILRDNIIYVIYEKEYKKDDCTAYVDTINLSTGEKDKITIDEIKSGNKDKDFNVYYKVLKDNNIVIVYKNLIENIEHDDNYKNDYQMINKNGTISLSDSEEYYITNKIDETGIERQTVFYKNSEKNINKEIYVCDKDGIIDICYIGKDLIQITVEHLFSSDLGTFWDKDQYVYYNTNTGKIIERKNGYNNIFLLKDNMNIKIIELVEDEEIKKDVRDIEKIEQDFSISKKRIENEVIEEIDEEIICEKVDLSMKDLLEYKDVFTGKKSMVDSSVEENENEKYSKVSEKNYNIIKFFVINSDDKFNEEVTKLLDEKHEHKYNKLMAAILSGIIKYYFDEDTNPINITMLNERLGGYEINLTLGNHYVMIYDFSDYGSDYIYILAYNDAKSFEDVYNNYEKYQGNNNTFLELYIRSYEFMRHWGWSSNSIQN